jgi:hypothetical protein
MSKRPDAMGDPRARLSVADLDRTIPRHGRRRASMPETAATRSRDAAMKANGFGIALLPTLVRSGLAVATPGIVQADGRTLGVVRLAITDLGRATVGG